MTRKINPNEFSLKNVAGQDDLKTTTEHYLSLSTIGASSAKTMNFNGVIPNDDISLQYTKEILEQSFKEVQAGDLAMLEQMLIGQAFALNIAFNSLSARATRQTDVSTMQMLMNLCFKAQNQSRATIDSLIQLKQPSQTTFVKQANIANGHQQVNNQVLAEKIMDSQNKLKGADDAELDYGRATKTKRSNKKMEALAKVHRSKDGQR
jgi:hypothetical protein